MDTLLESVHSARLVLAAVPDDVTASRAALADALQRLLHEVASKDVAEDARRAIDASLVPHAVALKGALFKALKACSLHRAFTGLPTLMEETRRLLAGAPAKGVASYLEVELCADVDLCTDPRALLCVQEVLAFMVASGRLKKDLGGFDLPAPSKKSCRTAANRASKRFLQLESEQRQRQQAGASSKPAVYDMPEGSLMDRDVRVEDAERAEARYAANVQGLDSMFEAAMKIKNGRLS